MSKEYHGYCYFCGKITDYEAVIKGDSFVRLPNGEPLSVGEETVTLCPDYCPQHKEDYDRDKDYIANERIIESISNYPR